MINENGKIAPAPWVPYTRAGCDVGAVATANTVLENTAIDIPTVFGVGIAGGARGRERPRPARRSPTSSASASTARRAPPVRTANNGKPDLLPDEPGGYSGYQGLFGAKYVDPRDQARRGPMTDLTGNTIQDASGSRLPRLRRHGGHRLARLHRPDAGARRPGHLRLYLRCPRRPRDAGNVHIAYGPGSAGYVAAAQGLRQGLRPVLHRAWPPTASTSRNTLFVFTVDEGDHFVGDQPRPGGLRRRDNSMHLQPGGRDQRRPAPHDLHPVRRNDPVLGPLGRRTERLRQRDRFPADQGPDRPHCAQPRTRDGRAAMAQPVHRSRSRATSSLRRQITRA